MSSQVPPFPRNVVTGASAAGLAVRIDGEPRTMPWRAVHGVTAGIIPNGPADMFVLGFDLADEGLTLLLGEVERAWQPVVDVLHLHLPGVEPFAVWGPRLLAAPGTIELIGGAE